MKGKLFRLRAIARKELRQIRRDPRTLIFLLVLPAFLLLMFGFALNFDVKHIPLAVCDQDRNAASRAFSESFVHTEYFDLKYRISDPREIDGLMGREQIRVALVIPPDFTKKLVARKEPAVQVIIDGANATSASTAAGYIAAIVQGQSIKMTFEILEGRGFRGPALPLRTETRVWYNPELRSAKFLVPGLMAFILMVILVMATALSIVREKERGTMEQIRISPVKALELVVGKTLPYALLSLLSSHLVLLLGYVLFGVPIRGNYFLLLLAVSLFLIGALGQGLLISTMTRTQQVAFMIAILATFLPTFVLSGFVFPVRNMPDVIQAFTYLVPAKYFLTALRSIILKGVGLRAFWRDLLFLVAFAGLMLGVSAVRLRRDGGEEPGDRKGPRERLERRLKKRSGISGAGGQEGEAPQ